jgi:hypothetical protein
MAVVPATYQVDKSPLREGVGATTAALATESEFLTRFPGVRLAPCRLRKPIRYGVVVDESLTKGPEIAFRANAMTLSYFGDYALFAFLPP